MRLPALVIAVLLAGWVLAALLPRPDRGLPTFAQAERDLGESERAHREGRLQEDPERRELRQAVLRAGERLDRLPCNESLRRDFVDAAIPFLRTVMATRDEAPVETFRVDGRVLNGTRFLDGQAIRRIERAVSDGLLHPEDLPNDLAWIANNPPEIEEAAAALRQLTPRTNCG